jgi:putative lipoprotein
LALLAALIAVSPMIGSAIARAADPDPWFGHDKELHFAASASLAVVGYAGTSLVTENRPVRAGVAAGFALGAGAAKELWDLEGHGDASWRDFTWDVVGTATGVAIAAVVDWLVHRYTPVTAGR